MTDEPTTLGDGGGDPAAADPRSESRSVGPEEIRALLARLARPHASGGAVVERAAILAAGPDARAILAWIVENGGEAEEQPDEPDSSRGLHRGRSTTSTSRRHPRRYVLPAGCL